MRSPFVVALVTLVISVASPLEVAAEDLDYDPLTLDRQTLTSSFTVDLGYEVWDDPPTVTDVNVIGINIGGQYVSPSGAGGYVAVPLSYVSIDSLLFSDSKLAIGNIEVGGLYAKRFRSPVAVVFHGGVALPTADDDGAGVFQAYASVPRYGDLVQRWPNSTWLRLAVSPMGRSGKLFWRADLGLDLALDDDNAGEDLSPVLRLNLGGGVDLGGGTMFAELATNVVDRAGDDSSSTFAIGGRLIAGDLRPGLGLLFPLGFGDSSQEDFIDFAVVVSLAGRVGTAGP